MHKAIFILLGIACVLGLVFAYIYFTQQEKISNPEKGSLSVSAEYNGKKVITGIKINGEEYNTTSLGYTQVEVPLGYIIQLENVNLDGQTFYKQLKTINISEKNIRYDFILEELKNLSVTKDDGNPINLTLYSENYEDLHFCLIWSLSYIFVKSNYTEIEKPKEYKNWGRCYKTDVSLKNSNIIVPISYQELSIPREKDYINISFFNPDFIENQKIVKLI